MILQSLVKYYEALEKKGDRDITKLGWSLAKVSFALELSEDGEPVGIIPLKRPEMRGKKTVMVPQMLKVPQQETRSSGVKPNFLCDNAGYILGLDNKGKPERALECFQSARERHVKILSHAPCKEAAAVVRFFETWNPQETAENAVLKDSLEEILAGANLIFSVNGVYPQDKEEVKAAWRDVQERKENGPRGICLVTGEKTEIARIHATIKGIKDAQSSGAALVSFNAPAFESYGKEQSYNAPVGTYAAYAYTTALNYLTADQEHTCLVGDTTVVYWSEDGEKSYQNVFAAVSEPTVENQEIVRGVFQNLEAGKAVAVDDTLADLSMNQRFYILGIAPNAARLAVRFFYQDSFGNILNHLKEHYERMRIVRPMTDQIEYYGVWRMLQETVNKKSKDQKAVPNLAGAVFRSIMAGSPYPVGLYQAVLGRIRAEQDDRDAHTHKITRGRAAIIKAFLLKNTNYGEEVVTVALNENSKNVAYTLGREFAVLEAIQEDANPGINATIKDRYFNAACATPASIFPILFKLKNSHVRKLSTSGKIHYERLLGDLQEKLTPADNQQFACPKRLSLEEQGMFILGYYHQTQKRFEKKTKEEVSNGGDN